MDGSEKLAEAEKSYASLVVNVADRQALPVRAIPYVTGWTISPDVVAENFARSATAGFEKLENTDTYHVVNVQPVKLLPKEWDRYVASLQGLDAELREKYDHNDQGYAAWVSQSVAKLPAGVFVWLDEFVADFELDYGPGRLSIMQEREGDRELNLSPFLERKTLNMVLEGFELRTPPRTHASGDDHASLVEYIYNGRVIDWQYWVQSMPTLSPGEACRLLAGLDPELFEDLTSRPVPQNNPSKVCSEAKRMERLAIAEKRDRQTPDEWYRWALEREFNVHCGFFMAVYGRHLRENEAQVLRDMPRTEASRWERAKVIGEGQRQVSTDYCRHISDASMTFPEFVVEVEERLARWRRGRYELVEAAQVLADLAGVDGKQLAEQMDVAIHMGKLAYRVNNIRVDPQHIPKERLWHRIVFQNDVNAWLAAEAIGERLHLEFPYPEAQTSALASESKAPIADSAYPTVSAKEIATERLRRFEDSLDVLSGFDPNSTPERDALARKFGSIAAADAYLSEHARLLAQEKHVRAGPTKTVSEPSLWVWVSAAASELAKKAADGEYLQEVSLERAWHEKFLGYVRDGEILMYDRLEKRERKAKASEPALPVGDYPVLPTTLDMWLKSIGQQPLYGAETSDVVTTDNTKQARTDESRDWASERPTPVVIANDSNTPAPTDRLTWWDVAGAYLIAMHRQGRYATAKALYKALEANIGSPDCPFEKGEGAHRGSLFIRRISQPVALKTVQNRWPEIKSAALGN